MNELGLDENHDISIWDGSFSRITGDTSEAFRRSVRQRILCMLRTELGEGFTDPEYGTPWLGEILGLPAPHLDVATKILREKISAVEGVARVISIRLKVAGRKISGTFRVACTDGGTAAGEF